MNLSNALALMIGKTDQINGNLWLPFWIHSKDVAIVMEFIYDSRFNSLAQICGISYEQLKKTAVLLAYLHDIGKVTPFFQSKIMQSVPYKKSIMEHYDINIPEHMAFIDKDKSPHTICGEAILLHFCFPDEFASIVGAHHGLPAEGKVRNHIEKYPSHYYGKPQNSEYWQRLWKEWIQYSLEAVGLQSINEIPKLNKRTQILLSGLLIMADWLASDQTKFELMDIDETLKEADYLYTRFERALATLDLPDVWTPKKFKVTEKDFEYCFSFSMNQIQKYVINAVSECEAPGIFILEAPMGIGKTEASLAAAEILARKKDKTGVFLGLPTQATANGIFDRIVDWAEKQSVDFYHTIMLAHGNAFFQPVFASMQNSIPQIDEDSDSGLVVHSFFKGNKQSLLADFVVGTIDRLLMSALKKKHAMLLHLGLSQKVVIIDECHAYDAYMDRYLDTALAWLSEYNVPVILLSATLPEKRRNELLNAYMRKDRENIPDCDKTYPQFTYTDGDEVKQIKLPVPDYSIDVQIIRMEETAMFEEVERAVAIGGCVGILCNTVLRAQYFADMFSKLDKAKVILYHAQYIFPDRAEKEKLLLEAVGKKSDVLDRRGTIVVGTQVLEQSLDIDFDILISDLCPMDLLLQRIGRLHRHKRCNRPAALNSAKCIVLGTEKLDQASEKIYSSWLLMRTRALLPDHVNLPGDIAPLVEETYKSSFCLNEEEKVAFGEYCRILEEKEKRAAAFLMQEPIERRQHNNLHNWLSGSVSENSALATVRDGISSIEVIVLVQNRDGSISLLPWRSDGKKYSCTVCPSDEDCKLIAQQKLRLPSIFCRPWNVDKVIGEIEDMDKHLTGFQKSHWLKGELVLLLNERLKASILEYELGYTLEGGLLYKREGEE